jgi:hypothetical protein
MRRGKRESERPIETKKVLAFRDGEFDRTGGGH